MVQVEVHDTGAAAQHGENVLEVWKASFGPVDDVVGWRETVWDRHRTRAGYRLTTAYDGDRLLGFSWGYTGQPGQFWSDFILDRLGPAVAGWVGGHFELVELAVIPDGRGRGVGGTLHDQLLAGLPHERALLGTEDDPTSPAVRLYRSRGWQRLGKQSPRDQVMGKVLGAAGSAAPPGAP